MIAPLKRHLRISTGIGVAGCPALSVIFERKFQTLKCVRPDIS